MNNPFMEDIDRLRHTPEAAQVYAILALAWEVRQLTEAVRDLGD